MTESQPAEATGFRRRGRELKTIAAMLRIYCRAHHHPQGAALCADCAAFYAYAHLRLQRCRFGEGKPACAQCTVHCYKPDRREEARRLMRWAGPRMALRHPLLTILHLIDARRPPPAIRRPG